MCTENVGQSTLDAEANQVLEFTPLVENIWDEELKGLPAGEAYRMQKRYPTTPEGMGTFLRTLYPRHYLQVQESVSQAVQQPWIEKAAKQGEINIVDIGSGPAVASLAITDLVTQKLKTLSIGKPVQFNYLLNDTSSICLETGTRMLDRYFLHRRAGNRGPGIHAEKGQVLTLSDPFPASHQAIHEYCGEDKRYHFLCAGYLLVPMNENMDLSRAANCIASLKQHASPSGGCVLMLQDNFHPELAHQVSHLTGATMEKVGSRQRVYGHKERDKGATYTYLRCRSLL